VKGVAGCGVGGVAGATGCGATGSGMGMPGVGVGGRTTGSGSGGGVVAAGAIDGPESGFCAAAAGGLSGRCPATAWWGSGCRGCRRKLPLTKSGSGCSAERLDGPAAVILSGRTLHCKAGVEKRRYGVLGPTSGAQR
jgi:hypothetical protein